MTKRFMRTVIDRELSLITVLEDLGVVRKGSLIVERTCYCPFHENSNTKAAKIYDDDAGVTLFCFSEQKTYRSSDALIKFSNEENILEKTFAKIWAGLSSESRSYYIDNFESGEESASISETWKKGLTYMSKFKEGDITYEQVLKLILAIIREDSK